MTLGSTSDPCRSIGLSSALMVEIDVGIVAIDTETAGRNRQLCRGAF
jgi:hypothetical protein